MAKIAAGYEPYMPTYQGRLSDQELTALIEYLKTLKHE
jgi:cytochrome c oxidase subunit 2